MHKLGGAIDCHEQIRLTLSGANFTDIDMQVADRIVFERGFVRCFLWLAGYWTDTVTRIQAVQAIARQMRNKPLERKEAVIQGEPSGAAKGDRCSLFDICQRGRTWLLGAQRSSSTEWR